MIKFAIVEDDRETRNALEFMLSTYRNLKCIGAFDSAENFMAKVIEKPVDVVLMDIKLPGLNGIKCIQQVKLLKPEIQFLMLTVLEDGKQIFDSLCAGATGYLIKNVSQEKLYESIVDIHNGGSPMSSKVARFVVDHFTMASIHSNVELRKLTSREHEILNLLFIGLHYKEIAIKISISTETVRTHIRNIYEKLHVNSRSKAIEKIFNNKI